MTAIHSISLPVSVTLTDVNDAPEFSEGESAARAACRRTARPTFNIGTAISATDEDGDALTYTFARRLTPRFL